MTWVTREQSNKRLVYDLLSNLGDTVCRVTFEVVQYTGFMTPSITSDNTFIGAFSDGIGGTTIPRTYKTTFEPISSNAITTTAAP